MDRHWQADLPAIQGDTVAGCVDYSGFDIGLGEHVRSRTHRNEIMKAKGLVEYTPSTAESEMLKIHKDGGSRTKDGRKEMDALALNERQQSIKEGVEKALGNDAHDHALRVMAGNAS
jgi:hypothetical protein